MMKAIIILDGTPEEIAALVVGLQGRHEIQVPTGNLSEAIRDTLLESAGKL